MDAEEPRFPIDCRHARRHQIRSGKGIAGYEDATAGALDGCVPVASDLATRSESDALIDDQARIFEEISATCSAMTVALASNDVAAFADAGAALEASFVRLADFFRAFDELMSIGDYYERVDTGPNP